MKEKIFYINNKIEFSHQGEKKAKDHSDKISSDATEIHCPTVATCDYLNLNQLQF